MLAKEPGAELANNKEWLNEADFKILRYLEARKSMDGLSNRGFRRRGRNSLFFLPVVGGFRLCDLMNLPDR